MHTIVKNVDLATFSFDLLKILQDKEANTVFSKFLQAEFNLDMLLFLHECNDLEQIPFPAQKQESLSLALHIYDAYVGIRKFLLHRYIQNTATTSPAKKQLKQLFAKQEENTTEWLLGEHFATPAHAFASIKNAILLELKSDSFPRFLRSQAWIQFLNSKTTEYIKSLGLPKAAVEFNYTEKDFEMGNVVTDCDFRFMDMLLEDNYGWELLSSNKKQKTSTVMCYYTTKNYLPNIEWFKNGSISKYTIVLPYDFDYCLRNLVGSKRVPCTDSSIKKVYDDEFVSNAELQQKHSNQCQTLHRSCCHVRFDVRLPFPLSPRRLSAVCSVEYKPELEQLVLINKPTISKHPLPKKWIEMRIFMAYMFKKIDSERTLLSQVFLFNAGGWTDSKTIDLNRILIPQRGAEIQRDIMKTLQVDRQREGGDMIAQCLEACKITEQRQAHVQSLQKHNVE